MGDNSRVDTEPAILSSPPDRLQALLQAALARAGGWLPFDRFMALALYAPGLGYYSRDSVKFGALPAGGSDFVTAPELSPWFGRALGRQVAEALRASGTDTVWEFGAGSGALAEQVLTQLAAEGLRPHYRIIDLSGSLRARQQARLQPFAAQVAWADALPETLAGVLLGNEVLDAMPVQLLLRRGGVWHERGVALGPDGALAWADRPTDLRPPLAVPGEHDYLTEIHPQAEAFVRTLAERWTAGVAFFIDYGFPEAEYYHPQRHMGTLTGHRAHQRDDAVLQHVGQMDITAHVNFTGAALAAQDAGLQVLGYTSQGRFLLNAGLLDLAAQAPLTERTALTRLVHEHEMGELFKVLVLAPPTLAPGWLPSGLAHGDRSHTL